MTLLVLLLSIPVAIMLIIGTVRLLVLLLREGKASLIWRRHRCLLISVAVTVAWFFYDIEQWVKDGSTWYDYPLFNLIDPPCELFGRQWITMQVGKQSFRFRRGNLSYPPNRAGGNQSGGVILEGKWPDFSICSRSNQRYFDAYWWQKTDKHGSRYKEYHSLGFIQFPGADLMTKNRFNNSLKWLKGKAVFEPYQYDLMKVVQKTITGKDAYFYEKEDEFVFITCQEQRCLLMSDYNQEIYTDFNFDKKLLPDWKKKLHLFHHFLDKSLKNQ